MTTAIDVRALRKRFGRLRAVDALNGVGFTIAEGEAAAFIGPNGAGKSTLMLCLAGLLFPTDGSIHVLGHRPTDLRVRARTGFVPERPRFASRMTGRQFLVHFAVLSGRPRAAAADDTERMLHRLELDAAADRRMSSYSRGMLQRLAIGQALLLDPEVLFLDEPTTALDPRGLGILRGELLAAKERGRTIVVNSHHLSEIERICDRALFLDGGIITREARLVDSSAVRIAVTFAPGTDAARLAESFGVALDGDRAVFVVQDRNDVADLVAMITGAGFRIIGVAEVRADLEAFFR